VGSVVVVEDRPRRGRRGMAISASAAALALIAIVGVGTPANANGYSTRTCDAGGGVVAGSASTSGGYTSVIFTPCNYVTFRVRLQYQTYPGSGIYAWTPWSYAPTSGTYVQRNQVGTVRGNHGTSTFSWLGP
jgi:hypothetical protein